jgi:hypothetical protein
MLMSRYAIEEEHDSMYHMAGEPAFNIVDTEQPSVSYGEVFFRVVCECWTREDAGLICNALNAAEGKH